MTAERIIERLVVAGMDRPKAEYVAGVIVEENRRQCVSFRDMNGNAVSLVIDPLED